MIRYLVSVFISTLCGDYIDSVCNKISCKNNNSFEITFSVYLATLVIMLKAEEILTLQFLKSPMFWLSFLLNFYTRRK